MKQLREITKRRKYVALKEADNSLNVDCRLLHLRADMGEAEKLEMMGQFARNLMSIKRYDVFLFAMW